MRDYQTKNNLSVDGIAGVQTLSSLYSASAGTSGQTSRTSQYTGLTGVSAGTQAALEDYQSGYAPSDSVNEAYQALQSAKESRPEEFSSSYEDRLAALYDEITNRADFSYDINGDALYKQYKDTYTNAGKLAMMDTMGQASALTGGYGSSYAATAGSQAYQSYLQQLNERVPELYEAAVEKYNAEGEDLKDQLSTTKELYDTEYDAHRDTVSDYGDSLEHAYENYTDERSFDYNDYVKMLSHWQDAAEAENSDFYDSADNELALEKWFYSSDELMAKYGSFDKYKKSLKL